MIPAHGQKTWTVELPAFFQRNDLTATGLYRLHWECERQAYPEYLLEKFAGDDPAKQVADLKGLGVPGAITPLALVAFHDKTTALLFGIANRSAQPFRLLDAMTNEIARLSSPEGKEIPFHHFQYMFKALTYINANGNAQQRDDDTLQPGESCFAIYSLPALLTDRAKEQTPGTYNIDWSIFSMRVSPLIHASSTLLLLKQ